MENNKMNIITLLLDWLYKVFYGLNGFDLLIIGVLLGGLCYWCYCKGYNNGKQAPRKRNDGVNINGYKRY